MANKWAETHQLTAYFLESAFQVRHLAPKQLQEETGAKGTVAAGIIQRLWEQDEACSSCGDRKRKLEPGVEEFLRKRTEAKGKAKADPAVKNSAAAAWRAAGEKRVQQLSIGKGNVEQQIQELAETIQQYRQSQLNLAAENERLREGQAGVQALAASIGELAKSLKTDNTDRNIHMDTKGLGRPKVFDNKEESSRRWVNQQLGCGYLWSRLLQSFGKLFGFRRPHRP